MTDDSIAPSGLNPAMLAALAKAQAKLGGSVAKDARNPHFRSEYATLGAVLRVAIPALSSEGIALIQYRDEAELVTMLGHVDGGRLEVRYPLAPTKPDPQGWGSAMTYARRYQLMALLGLAAEDDDGNAASMPQSPKTSKAKHPPRNSKPSPKADDEWLDRASRSIAAAAAVLEADDLAAVLGCDVGEIDQAISKNNLAAIGRDHARTLLDSIRKAGRDILGQKESE